jgi:hypothetical protein
MKEVYVLTGHSESGDNFGPLVFSIKPSKQKLRRIAFEWDGDEGYKGPNSFGSYVSLALFKVTVDNESQVEQVSYE